MRGALTDTERALSDVFGSITQMGWFYPSVKRTLEKLLIELDLPVEFRAELRTLLASTESCSKTHAAAKDRCQSEFDRLNAIDAARSQKPEEGR